MPNSKILIKSWKSLAFLFPGLGLSQEIKSNLRTEGKIDRSFGTDLGLAIGGTFATRHFFFTLGANFG